MQCAAYGLSTDRLTPHPFNLCSNAGSTHTSRAGLVIGIHFPGGPTHLRGG